MVMVFLRLGNLFLSGLVIYRLVEDSFQAVLKYLLYTFLSFVSSSMIMRLLSSTFPLSYPFSLRYDSRSYSTFLLRSSPILSETVVYSRFSYF